jgi:hypothetical protein
MPVIPPQRQLVHSERAGKTVQIGLSILKPNFSKIACLCEIWAK